MQDLPAGASIKHDPNNCLFCMLLGTFYGVCIYKSAGCHWIKKTQFFDLLCAACAGCSSQPLPWVMQPVPLSSCATAAPAPRSCLSLACQLAAGCRCAELVVWKLHAVLTRMRPQCR